MGAAVLALVSAVWAADPAGAPAAGKPVWLGELSVGIKETYDDNVFVAGAKHPPVTIPPAGSALAVRGHSSWITAVSPKLVFQLAPLLGKESPVKTLSVGYTPEFTTFHDEDSESFNVHRISAAIKGKADRFSFNLENAFSYIDGDKNAPVYPGSQLNAYGTAILRERREQFQDRATISLQYDEEKWFARLTSSLLYYELLTRQRTDAGHQNYADRYDVNGGADVGYRLQPQLALTLGYRYGHQFQGEVIGPALSSSSDYHRVLFGIEGKPWNWLTVAFAIGPDFRDYADTAPVPDRETVTYFGEASLTAQITAKDTLAFKFKQFQWVSSTGRIPYFDSSHTLTYNRKLTPKLLADLSGRILSSDYTSAQTSIGGPRVLRDDWLYTVSTGLAYTFNPNLSATLTCSLDLGRSAQAKLPASVAAEEQREFNRHMVSCGLAVKF